MSHRRTYYIRPETHALLTELAKRHGMSVSELIRRMAHEAKAEQWHFNGPKREGLKISQAG